MAIKVPARLNNTGEKILDINIAGGTITNTPIGKGGAVSGNFGALVASSVTNAGAATAASADVGGALAVSGSASLGALVVNSVGTFVKTSGTGTVSGQAGFVLISLGGTNYYLPLYTGLG